MDAKIPPASALRRFTPAGKPLIVTVACAAAMLVGITAPLGMSPEQAQLLAIVLVTLSLWGTSLVPSYLASLIFFAFVLVANLAEPAVVFSGFGSAAIWLIVSGFVIGAAISRSGLGARLASLIGPALTGSYFRLIGGLMLTAMALGFVMPSSVGRAAVLVPVGMALADRVGFGPGSNGRIGVAVILAIGCNMPSFAILPSNIPNMVLAGASETIWSVHFGYMAYLALHYPVLGLIKAGLTVLLVARLFPAQVDAVRPANLATAAGPASGAQIRVGLILIATLALWMTDSLHGINSAWIGLVAAVALMLPRIGVVTPPAFKNATDFGILLFVAGALALGALVDKAGLGTMFGDAMRLVLPLAQGNDLLNFMSLSLMAMATGLFTTIPGVPAVLTPMAGDLAAQTGFSLQMVLMTQVIGFSTPLFPYQLAPLVVAMQFSGEKLESLPRVILPLAAITVLILLPLDFLWWHLLGWI